MTTKEALLAIGEKTAAAVASVLETLGGRPVEQGSVSVIPTGTPPLESVPTPAVAAKVDYLHGVTGGNVLVMTRAGARRLAAAMMGQEQAESEGDAELSELELSAVAEAANQMMASAAAATSHVLGHEVEISAPETYVFATAEAVREPIELTPHATTVSFLVLGEACRLVQLIPNAFVIRMTRALEELETSLVGEATGREGALATDSIRQIPVRVWAELGRAQMPIARAVGLPTGAVVKLDRGADDLVDLYVNGRRFAAGSLLVVEGEWAVRVEALVALSDSPEPVSEGGDS
jgi:flagellar motor switch protein FliN/FliY